MKNVIICSLNDPAGSNIRERLLENFPFTMLDDWFDGSPVYVLDDAFLVTSKKDIVFVDGLDQKFADCSYFFVSRHRAESGIPSLTAHFTGNFGPANFGGNPREIAMYSPAKLKNYMRELHSIRSTISDIYKITIEATHHGPTDLHSPVLFVELGSSEEQWVDIKVAERVAIALMASMKSDATYSKCALGVGGTHYPDKFNKYLLESEIALGPVVSKYALENLDEDLLNQILIKSDTKVEWAIVDRKGLGQHKERVLQLLKSNGLEIISV
ncbi:MAG: D-tyrosyl-tRNA(Tyr) deacylase [Nitrososphaerota archaeon]|nr:D-tyrosyl-tRNA(Tyr) deacylase [Nitrososphaerota archaeon]